MGLAVVNQFVAGAATMGLGEVSLRIVGAIVALVLVLFLAWLLLNWLGNRMPGLRTGSGRLIQVLDRVSLGRSSGLMLVRVHTRVLLVGFSDKTIELISEFDDPDETIKKLDDAEPMGFQDALKSAAKQLGFGKKKDASDAPDSPGDADAPQEGEGE